MHNVHGFKSSLKQLTWKMACLPFFYLSFGCKFYYTDCIRHTATHMHARPWARGTHEDPGQLTLSTHRREELWCGGVNPDFLTNLWITGTPNIAVDIYTCTNKKGNCITQYGSTVYIGIAMGGPAL